MRFVARTLVVLATVTSAQAAPVAIGDRLVPFALQNHDGRQVSLTSFEGQKALVLMFIATQCPVSNAYNVRMAAIAKEYGAKGVVFVGVNSNKQESVAEIGDHANAHGFSFPVLKDAGNGQADVFGAQVTPEVYVYDAARRLVYHGRIDNRQRGDHITSPDLRNALDALLAGREVAVKETKAFGCTIKRVEK